MIHSRLMWSMKNHPMSLIGNKHNLSSRRCPKVLLFWFNMKNCIMFLSGIISRLNDALINASLTCVQPLWSSVFSRLTDLTSCPISDDRFFMLVLLDNVMRRSNVCFPSCERIEALHGFLLTISAPVTSYGHVLWIVYLQVCPSS